MTPFLSCISSYKTVMISILITLFSLAGALAGAPQANATSMYDDAIQLTDKAELVSPDGSKTYDITYEYVGMLFNSTDPTCQTVYDNYEPQIGGFGNQVVFQSSEFDFQQTKQIWLYFEKDGSTTGELGFYYDNEHTPSQHAVGFNSYSGGEVTTSNSGYPNIGGNVRYSIDNNGNITLDCWVDQVTMFNRGIVSSTLDYENRNLNKILFNTFPINYPPDYEGLVPPTNLPSNLLTLYPRISIDISDERTVRPQFVGGFTTDEGDLVMIDDPDYLIFTLTDENEQIITPSDYQMYLPYYENVPMGNYKIFADAVYTDGTENEYDFQTTEFLFQVTNEGYTIWFNEGENAYCSVRNGTEWNCNISQPYQDPVLITGEPADIWSENACFLETFPFVDVPACLANMEILINLLSFKTLDFNNNWTGSNNCRNLVVLGDWINLPAYQVCPQFSQTIRSIITPFVTFALGLITVMFLTRREGYLQ